MTDQPVAVYRLGDEGVAVRSIRVLLQASRDLAPASVEHSCHGRGDDLIDGLTALRQLLNAVMNGDEHIPIFTQLL